MSTPTMMTDGHGPQKACPKNESAPADHRDSICKTRLVLPTFCSAVQRFKPPLTRIDSHPYWSSGMSSSSSHMVQSLFPRISSWTSISRACQLAALAIPDSLRRQRWIPTSSRGQYTDRRRDGLNQHAERNHQQCKACAGSVDVGLEPRFVWHAEKFR